jgi:hypothetical protein
MAGMVALALMGVISNGWAGRFPDEVARLESYANAYNPRREECHRDENKVFAMEKSCVYGAATPPTFAVWGDSHAIELSYALGEVAARHQKSVMQFTYSSCPPSLGLEVSLRPNCREYNDTVVAFLAQDHEITTVFLVAAYAAHHWQIEKFSKGIRQAVGVLLGAGKRVVLVYPIPTASASIPRTLAHYAAVGAALDSFTIDEAEYLKKNAFAFQLLDSISDANVVHVLPHERLCDGGVCAVQVGGAPLYYDQQHLKHRRRPVSGAAVRPAVPGSAGYCSFVASCFASSIPRKSGSPASAFPIASRARSLRPFSDIAAA